MKKMIFLGLFFTCFLFGAVMVSSASEDVMVFQGQYYEGEEFMSGLYDFVFNIYDSREGGNLIYTRERTLRTGEFGEWSVELENISQVANDSQKDYFMEILINGEIQGERRRLTQLKFVRKAVDQTFVATTTFNAPINSTNRSYFNEIFVENKRVCLEDGTNCPLFNFTEEDPLFVLENRTLWNKIEERFLNFSFQLSAINLTPYVQKSELNYFIGDYNDLFNKPTIPVDTKLTESEVDEFVSNNGYLTSYLETDPFWSSDKENYYLKEEVDSLLAEKISLPVEIIISNENVESWLSISSNRIAFNENKLNSFIESKKQVIDLSNFYTKLEIDDLLNEFDFEKLMVNGKNVCLEDGTNCVDRDLEVDGEYLTLEEGKISFNDSKLEVQGKYPVMFMSTIRGSLSKQERYLPMAISVSADHSSERASFLIGKDLVITSIYWAADYNSLSSDAELTLLKSVNGKNNFRKTDLVESIDDSESGKSENYEIVFSSGDSAVLMYDPKNVKKGAIGELSVTLVGYYL